MSAAIPVVAYGCKSSPDERESVADQHRQTLAAIEREDDRYLIAEPYGEANASGYRKERGPALEAAMAAAIAAAAEHGEAELWVFHSSRLARGDGTKGKRSIALVVAQLLYENVRVRSVSDDPFVTPMLAGIGSETAHKYSEDLSAHVRRGLRQRKESGKPVGPLPLGYMPEPVLGQDGQPVIGQDGKPLSTRERRVVDPAALPTVERIFAMVEAGDSFGQVSRTLNAEGVPTRRGGTWISRTVRELVHNEVYAGRKGYPAIIDPDRFDAILAGLRRLDPAAVQRRKGGTRPADPSFWLRGVGFCLACGASLYSRHLATGRVYLCRNVRLCTGLCHAKAIPADLIEGHVLDHLDAFVGDAEAWLAQQAAERVDGRQQLRQTARRLRDELAALDRRRDLVLADYEQALSEGDAKARIVLEVATRLDTERDGLTARLANAEALAAEWEDAGDSGLAESVDLVRALASADTAEALNRAMAKAVAGIHAAIVDGRLRAEFALKHPEGVPYLFRHAAPVGLAAERITLPDAPESRDLSTSDLPAEPCGSPRSTDARSGYCSLSGARPRRWVRWRGRTAGTPACGAPAERTQAETSL